MASEIVRLFIAIHGCKLESVTPSTPTRPAQSRNNKVKILNSVVSTQYKLFCLSLATVLRRLFASSSSPARKSNQIRIPGINNLCSGFLGSLLAIISWSSPVLSAVLLTSSITLHIWKMHCVICSALPFSVTARSVEFGNISLATWIEQPVNSRISLIFEPPLPGIKQRD